jgi:hypothetical protein
MRVLEVIRINLRKMINDQLKKFDFSNAPSVVVFAKIIGVFALRLAKEKLI